MKDNDFKQSIRFFPLAMAYVPWQNFGALYDPEKAFKQATIFQELDKPFIGRRKAR
jgi:hypothetical protein